MIRLCELDTTLCVDAAHWAEGVPFFRDYVSSAYYYSDVIRFGAVDDDYVAAHRMCAFFTLYNIGILMCCIGLVMLTAPAIASSALEVVLAVCAYLVDVQAAENASDS